MGNGALDRGHLSIREVLDLLVGEFPDVTISKIRFLESRGLIHPERTPSGYRKFYAPDVERLRWILRQQREHFLPLKVIKGRLEGGASPGRSARAEVAGAATLLEEAQRRADPDEEGAERGEEERALVGVGARSPGHAAGAEAAHAAGAEPKAAPGGGSDAATGGPGAEERHRRPVEEGHGSVPGEPPPEAPPGEPPEGGGGPVRAPRHSRDRAGAAHDPAPRRERQAGAAAPPAPEVQEQAAEVQEQAAEAQEQAAGAGPRTPERGAAPEGQIGSEPTAAGEPPAGGEPDPEAAGAEERAEEAQPAPAGGRASSRRADKARAAAEEAPAGGTRFNADELAEAAGVDPAVIAELEEFRLLAGRVVAGVRCYDEDALLVARVAAGFRRFGLESRHLRTFKHAAEREASLFSQVVTPLLRQRNPEARTRAEEDLLELARLGAALAEALVRAELRELTGG